MWDRTGSDISSPKGETLEEAQDLLFKAMDNIKIEVE